MVKNRVMLVGGATPGDPAAPVHGTTTPTSPEPDKTRQPNIYGSLASNQDLEVLCGDPLSPFLVPPIPPGTPPPGISQILDPRPSVMGPPLPQVLGSI